MLPNVGSVFVPVKTMRILRVCDAMPKPVGLNAEAWRLLDELNHQLQLNSSSWRFDPQREIVGYCIVPADYDTGKPRHWVPLVHRATEQVEKLEPSQIRIPAPC
jgi:hypothetical protein